MEIFLLEANEFPCENVTYKWKWIENLGNNSDFYKDKKKKKKMKKKVKHPNSLNLLGLSSFNQFFMTPSLVQTLKPVYWVFYLERSFERKYHNMQCLYGSNMHVLVLQTGVSVAFIYLGQWW